MALLVTSVLWLQLLGASLSDDIITPLSDDVITPLSDDIIITPRAEDDVTRGEGMCVAYGLCQLKDGLPCVNNTAAQSPPDDQAVREKLIKICPHLRSAEKLCCTGDQINFLGESLKTAEVFLKSCGHCYQNFRSLFCDIVCNPNQSQFITVEESEGVDTDSTYVTKFTYHLSEQYATNLYESCSQYKTTLCGPSAFWLGCNREKMFAFLGDNSYTVLKTDFTIGDGDISPLVRAPSDHLIPCNDYTNWDRCICSNCKQSCEDSSGQDGLQHTTGTCLSTSLTTDTPTVQNVPAVDLQDSSVSETCRSTISAHCPSISTTSCCSSSTLDLSSSFTKLDSLFGNCGNCQENVRKLLCQYLFSPDQSLFTNVQSSSELGSGQVSLTEMQLVISKELADKIYESCKNVRTFVEHCQGKTCSLQSIFTDLLAETGVLVPAIKEYNQEPYISPDIDTFKKCNDEGEGMCSCEDCPATCGVKDGHEHKPGHCILVGNCDEDFFKVDDKAAFSQTTDSTLLQEVCPLYTEGGTGCCTDYSLNFLKILLDPIKQATSCVVCAENIAQLMCTLTCSPDQSVSLEVLSQSDDWWCNEAVSIRFYVERDSMQNLLDTCRDDANLVKYLCGENPDQCHHLETFNQKLFEKMSNSDRNMTLLMEENYSDITPLPLSSLPCSSTSPLLDNQTCSCDTCTQSCSPNAPDGYYHSPGVCTMYSTCNNEEDREAPCVGNTRARYLSQEERDSLTELCPSYQPGTLGCCDEKSVNVMKSLLGLASSLIKCHNCYNNLAKLFCNVFCNSDQSTYLSILTKTDSAVSKFSYHVKEEIGRELFESCRHDSSGITNLICITKYGRDCASYLDFIHAIGDNGVTTFDIAFKFLVEEPFVLDSPELLSCEQNYNGYTCECEDCPAACNNDFDDKLVHKKGICLIASEGVVNGTESFLVESSKLLAQVCPELSWMRKVCCNNKDLELIDGLFKNEEHQKNLGSCPACYNNMRRHLCHVACSPDQSTFATLHTDSESDTKQINHFLDEKSSSKLYDSCSYYNGGEEAVEESRFFSEIVGGLVSELYAVSTYSVNDRNFMTPDIKVTKVQYLKNCYDPGDEMCGCDHCKESCTEDNYQHSENLCLFYDTCEGDFPCVNNTRPHPVNPSDELFYNDILTTCPQYINSSVCCSHSQLESFSNRVSAARAIIGGCPACYANFVNVFCHLMCDPNQSAFQQVVSERSLELGNVMVADKIRYHVSEHFAQASYDSCKNVKSGNTEAINLICDSLDCDMDDFYLSLGINKYTDLKVFYEIYNPESEKGKMYSEMNISPLRGDKVLRCNDIVDGKTCSCSDCPAACDDDDDDKNDDNTNDNSEKQTRNYDNYLIPVLAVVWLSLTVLFLAVAIHPGNPRKGDGGDLVLTNLATKSTVPLSEKMLENENVYDDVDCGTAREKVPIKTGKVEFKGPPVNVVLSFIRSIFSRWADIIHNFPWVVLSGCVVCVMTCCIGLIYFRITYDPVELWTTPTSQSRINKEYFEETFGTPYRAAQLIFSEKIPGTSFESNGKNYSSIFRAEHMNQIYKVQSNLLANVAAQLSNRQIKLSDVCYKPLGIHDDGDADKDATDDCVIQSPFQWRFSDYRGRFFEDRTSEYLPSYLELFEECGQLEYSPKCFGSYRGPIMANAVFGGYDADSDSNLEYLTNSRAVILTFVISGEASHREEVLAWEKEFGNFMKNVAMQNLTVSYNCDRSLEDELDRASHADIMTIVISYILMFVYVSTTLGRLAHSGYACCIQAKVSIGLTGVALVLISVTCALGITSFFQLPATLVVIEVVPFLVLAVGVDNVYILVQSLQKKVEERSTNNKDPDFVKVLMRDVLADVGPSMLMSSTCQTVAFSLGALSTMPAVQNFAWNAALAVLIDFLLQISAFVVILTLDVRRELSLRADCGCCFQLNVDGGIKNVRGPVRFFIQNIWAEVLFVESNLGKIVRALISSFFVLCTLTSVILITRTSIGLDESLALPSDSHVKSYFDDIFEYLNLGPQVHFVFRSPIEGTPLEIFDEEIHRQLVDSPTSVYNLMKMYSDDDNERYLTGTVGSWLSQFEDNWLTSSTCCRHRHYNTSQFCPSKVEDPTCTECEKGDRGEVGNVTRRKYKHLGWFLKDVPQTDGDKCIYGGKAQFGSSVKFSDSGAGVTAAYFTLSHPRLSGSNDFIASRKNAIKLSEHVNRENNLIHVFPYSSAYHFYEQYDTIVKETTVNLTICILAVFIVSFFMLGFQIYPSLVILMSITMVIVDMMGVMVMVGIPLNAISLVNLIMSVGIAVEFSAHIVKSYVNSPDYSSSGRAKFALVTTGPSVFSGITLTKFVGIVVLAFAKSKLFEVFYFRMFLSVIVLGATHSLVFLPAFLSLDFIGLLRYFLG
ncbi:hypothetical protein ACHWQZ_G017834 [Mnemiopsis leidyi]